MRRERFLRSLVWLPVALPVLAFPAARLDGLIGSFAGTLCWGLYALPIYGLIAAIFLGRMRGSAPRSYWTIAVLAPVIFLAAWYAIAVLFSLLAGIVSGEWSGVEWSSVFLAPQLEFPGTVLAVGYFYVAVAWLLYSTANRMGWLSDSV